MLAEVRGLLRSRTSGTISTKRNPRVRNASLKESIEACLSRPPNVAARAF